MTLLLIFERNRSGMRKTGRAILNPDPGFDDGNINGPCFVSGMLTSPESKIDERILPALQGSELR